MESHIVQPQYHLNRDVTVIKYGINVPNFGDYWHPKTMVEPAGDAEEAGWESESERGANVVQPYVEAGATWWSENINGWRGSFKEMRERIRQGPPAA